MRRYEDHVRFERIVLFLFAQKLHEEIKNIDDEIPNIVISVR